MSENDQRDNDRDLATIQAANSMQEILVEELQAILARFEDAQDADREPTTTEVAHYWLICSNLYSIRQESGLEKKKANIETLVPSVPYNTTRKYVGECNTHGLVADYKSRGKEKLSLTDEGREWVTNVLDRFYKEFASVFPKR